MCDECLHVSFKITGDRIDCWLSLLATYIIVDYYSILHARLVMDWSLWFQYVCEPFPIFSEDTLLLVNLINSHTPNRDLDYASVSLIIWP